MTSRDPLFVSHPSLLARVFFGRRARLSSVNVHAHGAVGRSLRRPSAKFWCRARRIGRKVDVGVAQSYAGFSLWFHVPRCHFGVTLLFDPEPCDGWLRQNGSVGGCGLERSLWQSLVQGKT